MLNSPTQKSKCVQGGEKDPPTLSRKHWSPSGPVFPTPAAQASASLGQSRLFERENTSSLAVPHLEWMTLSLSLVSFALSACLYGQGIVFLNSFVVVPGFAVFKVLSCLTFLSSRFSSVQAFFMSVMSLLGVCLLQFLTELGSFTFYLLINCSVIYLHPNMKVIEVSTLSRAKFWGHNTEPMFVYYFVVLKVVWFKHIESKNNEPPYKIHIMCTFLMAIAGCWT